MINKMEQYIKDNITSNVNIEDIKELKVTNNKGEKIDILLYHQKNIDIVLIKNTGKIYNSQDHSIRYINSIAFDIKYFVYSENGSIDTLTIDKQDYNRV